MADTFTIEADCASTALDDALIAIVNRDTADPRRYVEIVEIDWTPTPAVAALAIGTLEWWRISAASGGIASAAIPHDTNSAALPAQVTAARYPAAVTRTSILRRAAASALPAVATAAQPQFVSRDGFRTRPSLLLPSSTNQGFTCREGQGFAVYLSDTAPGKVGVLQLEVVLRVVATSAIYTYTEIVAPSGPVASWALVNGAGSGVVLEIASVAVVPMGTAIAPLLRLVQVDDVIGGEALTPSAHDSGGSSWPATIAALRGPAQSLLAGARRGGQLDWASTHGAAGATIAAQQAIGNAGRRGLGAWTSYAPSGALGSPSAPKNGKLWRWPQGSGIVLRAQTGLALSAGGAGVLPADGYASGHVRIVAIHTAPPAGGGGAGEGVYFG